MKLSVPRLALVTLLTLFTSISAMASTDPLCRAPGDVKQWLDNQSLSGPLDPLLLHRLLRCGHDGDNPIVVTLPARLLDAGVSVDSTDYRGRSALHAALEFIAPLPQATDNLYRDTAMLLLARGADPNLSDQDGIRPLHLASREGDGMLSETLMALGADPTARDNSGRNALDHALAHPDNSETFAILLEQQPALTEEQALALAQRTILLPGREHSRIDLLAAMLGIYPLTLPEKQATEALLEGLRQGLSAPALDRIYQAGTRMSALQQADLGWELATHQRAEQLDWLLALGFDLNILPASGFPPLYFANDDATRLLLGRGADPALPSRTHGTVAASFIAPPPPFSNGGVTLTPARLRLLLDGGYPLDTQDPQGYTALERAIDASELWLVQALLGAGASPLINSAREPSLLPQALSTGRLPLVQALLRVMPDINHHHPTLLPVLAATSDISAELMAALLVAGIDIDQVNEYGDTALLVAARQQRWPLVQLLLDYGASKSISNQQGCSLHCYSWAMPEALQLRVAGDTARWQWPSLNTSPSAFFALSLTPMLTLWLLVTALALAWRTPLWPSCLWMLACAGLTMAMVSALFYQCEPCLLRDSATQHYASMTVAAVLFLIGPWRARLRPHAVIDSDRASEGMHL
ncbi:MAG: hypothetical protein CVV10_02945 [Gammaproteobacteria bacterium HGW-Gammaproteobacteria-14]|nr:MAG: hypothetical protein CVV10_02945 [Gammaproteobacteria bacterium HGW-Gammaproteobacteria-14]